jgi:thiol:disulfide interchange protein
MFLRCIFALLFLFFLNFNIQSRHLDEAHTKVFLKTTHKNDKNLDTFYMAVTFKVEGDWHLYWKNPGDSGMPPQVNWQLPDGVSMAFLGFPVPLKIPSPPFVTYGYYHELTLLYRVTVKPGTPSESFSKIKADIKWLACERECVQGMGELIWDDALAYGDHELENDLAQHPKDLPAEFTVTYNISNEYAHVKIKNQKLSEYKKVEFYPETRDVVHYSKPQPLQNNVDHWILDVPLMATDAPMLDGVLVFEKNNGDKVTYAAKLVKDIISDITFDGYGLILLMAFLGGLILNFMPCVFPVISLKILHFADQKNTSLRAEGLAYTYGVLASFFILGVALSLLRLMGNKIGWGFQLQSAPFVIFLSALFLTMGLNLFGVFEMGVSLTTVNLSAKTKDRFFENFMTGVLAVVVATPCSAPFMGTALGVGLNLPWILSAGIFLSLGAGMASPFLVLSFIPSFAKLLPRPGKWMEILKQFLGFPMLATVIWLLWVLEQFLEPELFVFVILGLFTLSIGLWVYGKSGGYVAKKGYKMLSGVILLSATCLMMSPIWFGFLTYPTFEAYSPVLLKKYQDEKQHIFLDFTARWCITCQVNKLTVLNSEKVSDIFKSKNVKTIRVDWTNNDPDVTDLLASYGRQSVPTYVVIDRNNSTKPIILPEILTVDAIESVIKKLS